MIRLLSGLLLGLLLWAAPAQAVIQQTRVGDAAYSITTTDINVLTTTAFTAARIWTLPGAGGTCIGQTCPAAALQIIDRAGAVTSSFTLTITPQSGETINGSSSSLVINYANARIVLLPTSGTNWNAYYSPPSGQTPGTATNDNAAAGNVGEYLTATQTSATTGGVVMASGTAMNVTQLLATAGDWDCRGNVGLNPAPTTIVSSMSSWTSSASASAYALGGLGNGSEQSIQIPTAGTAPNWILGAVSARYSLAASTSIYLSARASFSTAAASAYGFLGCRRMR